MKKVMNKQWKSHEQKKNKFWKSPEHKWASHDQMIRPCASYEQVMNKSWKSFEQVMNKLWTCQDYWVVNNSWARHG